MNNEEFFDILGGLDDSMISDAAFTVKKKKQGSVMKIITLSAAVFIFVIVGILIKNNLLNTDYVLPTEETVSDSEISAEYVTDEITTVKNEITSVEEITSRSEQPSQSEEPSSDIGEPFTEEYTVTGEVQGGTPENKIVFVDTDILNLFSADVDSGGHGYPISEKTDIFTLQDIYGTKIIPSYLPTAGTETTISSIEKKYTVYYNEDKTETFCKNYFTFLLKGGNILTVTASTEEISMLDTEKENISSVSCISGTPVLLLRGTKNGFVPLYSAYFQKDGCYFRIQLQGISPDKDEFIKIVTSVIC